MGEDGSAVELSYGGLLAAAQATAAGLLDIETSHPGDTVALMLPTSRDYFTAFFGIVLAGAVPVPLYPAHAARARSKSTCAPDMRASWRTPAQPS